MLFKKNKKNEIVKEKEMEEKVPEKVSEETGNEENRYMLGIINDADDLMLAVIDELTKTKMNLISEIKKKDGNRKQFMEEIKAYLYKFYGDYKDLFADALYLIENYIFDYFRITPLINDPDITDIHILDYDNIRFKKKGVRQGSDIKFRNREEYLQFVQYIATKNQTNISNINATQRFSDNNSMKNFILRFAVSTPLITTPEVPYVAIRKIPRDFYSMDDLVREKFIVNDNMKNYLIERFNQGSTLICGPSASGKTTLLNAIKETIPETESVMVVQETEELTTKVHPDMMFERPIINRGESKVQYTLYDIIASGLLMDIERFIIGEIKGEEALYLLNASYTGHICAATVHSESAVNALDKLVDYAKYKSNYSKEELMKMMTSFKTIIFVDHFKICQIVEVEGWNYHKKEPNYNIFYDKAKINQ